ncbi:MAG: hypothetical protein RL708_2276 [Bacteroidota bacterium]|jgi:anti-sigma-K factor RskA
MTPKELIDSGLLELYVSGTLPESEGKLIAATALQFGEVADEIKRIEAALIAALENEEHIISPTVKNNIFAAINLINDDVQKPVVPLRKWNMINWAAAAMIVLLIGATFVIVRISKQKNELSAQRIQTELDLGNLQNRVSFLQQASDKAAEDMAVYRSHDYKKIMMMPVSSAHHEMACVYYNPLTHKLYIDNCGLPNPGEDKTYQLWAMKNGKPISAGLLDREMYNKGLQAFANVDGVEAFAITIEDKGGAALPTLSALQVAGNI